MHDVSKTIFGFLSVLTVFCLSACQPKTKTGIEVVDKVASAVLAGDVARQRELLQFRSIACTTADGLGGPPKCAEGEADGTPVEVLPTLGSEGYFLRKAHLESWQGIQVDALYAVYQVSEAAYSDEFYPSGAYVAVFTSDEPQTQIFVHISEIGIVRLDYQTGTSPEEKIEREAKKNHLETLTKLFTV